MKHKYLKRGGAIALAEIESPVAAVCHRRISAFLRRSQSAATMLILAALCLCASVATAQQVPPSAQFGVDTVTLPFSTLAPGVYTNLANGWSTIINVTNTSVVWSNGCSCFVTNSPVVSATNTVYADMGAAFQKDLGFMLSENVGTLGSNVMTFARFLDSGSVDTNNQATVTISHSAAGRLRWSTNFPPAWIGGFGGVRLTSLQWTNGTGTWTNDFFKKARKVNAP